MEYAEIARAETPRGEVVLRERQDAAGPAVLELRVNGIFVMDNRETGSERALATQALEVVDDPRNVLVGGLGLGFTARELLHDTRVERIDVVEIEECLIGWTRDGTVPDLGLLADSRVHLIHADVAMAIEEVREATYDLVLLDVDNGPGYLVYDDNAAIYREPFLRDVAATLLPDGAAVIWSADEAPELAEAMAEVFAETDAQPCAVTLQDRDESYWLYVGRGVAAE